MAIPNEKQLDQAIAAAETALAAAKVELESLQRELTTTEGQLATAAQAAAADLSSAPIAQLGKLATAAAKAANEQAGLTLVAEELGRRIARQREAVRQADASLALAKGQKIIAERCSFEDRILAAAREMGEAWQAIQEIQDRYRRVAGKEPTSTFLLPKIKSLVDHIELKYEEARGN